MCRNIRTLYNFAPPATPDEVRAAALQYVRKVSGMTKPSQVNTEAFELAVDEIAAITERLLTQQLETSAPPRDREKEKEKAREKWKKRDERTRIRILSEIQDGT
jgi:hypothetical protein